MTTLAINGHITGWDIGGAHLKFSHLLPDGTLASVQQISCPLWQGIDALHTALALAFLQLPPRAHDGIAALTMTGELADCFENRQIGVAAIVEAFCQHHPAARCQIYTGDKGWCLPAFAAEHWQSIASRNWQASADCVAREISTGLFVDLGSTTCDIIPLQKGVAVPQGVDDYHRQISGTLCYTGTIRTPLIALASHAPFRGQQVGLAAEVFATTGDCWLLCGVLDPSAIQDLSADGQPWSRQHSVQRLARMLGTDADAPNDPCWQTLAEWFAEQHIHRIITACEQVLGAANLPVDAPVIGAGIGREIIARCAASLNRPFVDVADLFSPPNPMAADHIPAAAVALLVREILP